MGRYARDAAQRAQKIEHFYEHAGSTGYEQAQYYWNKLHELMASAARSTNDKGDAPVVHGIIERCQAMMDEMKARTQKPEEDTEQ